MFGSIHSKRQESRGFTLIELLVVIAIIAILAAILFPVFAKARDNAKLTRCIAHLGQIGKAIQAYCDDNTGYYPPGPAYTYSGTTVTGLASSIWVSNNIGAYQKGMIQGAPYPKDTPLFKYTSGNREIWKCPSELMQSCESYPSAYPSKAWGSSYVMNGVYDWGSPMPDDGHSNLFYTLMGTDITRGCAATRKNTDVVHTTKIWMAGERTMHYYWNVRGNQGSTAKAPKGHMGDKPFSPVVYCDGHTGTVFLTSDTLVDPNGKFAFCEKGWNPKAPSMGM